MNIPRRSAGLVIPVTAIAFLLADREKAFTTRYQTEMTLQMSPDQGMGEITQTMTGRLLGDCK